MGEVRSGAIDNLHLKELLGNVEAYQSLTPALSGRAGEIRACKALNEIATRCPRPLKRLVRFRPADSKRRTKECSDEGAALRRKPDNG